jgi:hypothetical protein
MKVSFVSHNEIGKKVIVLVGDIQKSLSKTEARMCMCLRYGDLPWPPRSPDLAAPDFFMGIPEGKCIPNKVQDLTGTKGLYSQKNP